MYGVVKFVTRANVALKNLNMTVAIWSLVSQNSKSAVHLYIGEGCSCFPSYSSCVRGKTSQFLLFMNWTEEVLFLDWSLTTTFVASTLIRADIVKYTDTQKL